MSDIVRYEHTDGVAAITLNRPDAMNSFTSQLSFDLLEALEKAHHDDSVRAVLLTGEGRCFSAGADLKTGLEGRRVYGKLQYEYRPVMTAVASMPKPVIAAVPGSAAGIGLSLALTCDLLIMADNAFLLSPFTTISLVPDGGLNWLLVRQLGYRRAFQLSIESERIDAERCVQLGLANKVVPAEELQSAARAWAIPDLVEADRKLKLGGRLPGDRTPERRGEHQHGTDAYPHECTEQTNTDCHGDGNDWSVIKEHPCKTNYR